MTQRASVTRLSERRSPREIPLAPPAAADDVQLVPHRQVHPSPLNPRKQFDPDELAELATSIATQGLLQNLVVRPHPTLEGHYELAAGERRWRAVALLIEGGTFPADANVKVALRNLTDEQLLMLGLAENVQRANMHPLEEAEAFVAFATLATRGEGATAEIAEKLGKTQRWVQQRIALATKLAPETKEAFAAGRITLEQAKAFLVGTHDQQRELLAEYIEPAEPEDAFDDEDLEDVTLIDKQAAHPDPAAEAPSAVLPAATPPRVDLDAHQIRRAFVRNLPALALALFPLERYTGDIVGDESQPPTERYFADAGLFSHLQEQAIAEKEAELAATHQSVETLRSSYFHAWDYSKAPEGQPARAIIHVDEKQRVQILTGMALADPADRDSGSSERSTDGKAAEPCTKALYAEARRRKTATLQDAIASDPKMALRLACLALLTPAHDAPHRVRLDHPGAEDRVLGAVPAKRFAVLAPHLPKDLRAHDEHESPRPMYGSLDDRGLKVWTILLSMSPGDVEKLHASLIAAQYGTFSGFNPTLGDSPLVVAIAEALEISHAASAALDDEWLAGYRKPRLLAVAKASGAFTGADDTQVLQGMTNKDLRAAILDSKARDRKYVAPEFYFGTEKALEQRATPTKAKTAKKTSTTKKPSKKR